ncbi:MAG: DUF3800 domain-containing protein [Chloroflexi bacterium]|nr:DUF3800 domain-containing protein [Chloroflexota bacterium]
MCENRGKRQLSGYEFGAQRGISSRYFVMVVLVVPDPERLRAQMAEARRRLGKSQDFEFHYRQASAGVRRVFFKAMAFEDFSVQAAVVDKVKAPESLRRQGKQGLYNWVLSGLALRAPTTLSDVKLWLDGQGKHARFLRELKNAVRRACRAKGRPQQNFDDVRLLTSKDSPIQCADMVAGAVFEKARTGESESYKAIRSKVEVWWQVDFGQEAKPP